MLTVLSTILSITILELMLSVDNALVNASLAEELPKELQKKALAIGIGIGVLLRVLCLFVASIIIQNPIIKIVGGLYLVWLAVDHFFRTKKEEKELQKHPHFWKVIGQIVIAGLVFSIDNVVGATGISSNFSYVVFGVLIGASTMIFVTPLMLMLMDRFPTLIRTAYVIIAYVGFAILVEAFAHFHVPEYDTFAFIMAAMIATMVYDAKQKKA